MANAEQKVRRFLGMKEGLDTGKELNVTFFDNPIFTDFWRIEGWFQKLIFILSFTALCWTIIERVFLGRW
jgi:hypothetical protein